MKGITPVISVVLLILILIAVIGLAFVFFSDTATSTQDSTQASLSNLVTSINGQFVIENQIGTNFNIRNQGKETISAGVLTVYADDKAVDAQILQPILPGDVGTITVPPEVIEENTKLRIVGTIYEQTVTIEKGEIIGEWP